MLKISIYKNQLEYQHDEIHTYLFHGSLNELYLPIAMKIVRKKHVHWKENLNTNNRNTRDISF